MDTLDFSSWSRHPAKVALVCGKHSITYADLVRRAAEIAGRLGALGVAGQRVALLLPNGTDLVCCYLACLEAGITAVPLNPRSTAAELDFYLTACDTPWLLTHGERLLSLGSALAPGRRLLAVEEPESWDVSPLAAHPGRPPQPTDSGSRPALIFFTSGTTDRPKGVVYSLASLASSIAPFFSAPFLRYCGVPRGEMVYLNIASMADTVGCIHVLWTLRAGGTAVLQDGFDTDSYLAALDRYRPTHSTLFLPHAIRLLAHPSTVRDRFRSLRILCFAGDKTPVELIQSCREITGRVPLVGYGMTESFVIALNLSSSPTRFGSMGRPVPGVEVRIAGPRGEPAAAGTAGEILVRSPQTMLGYWRDPIATKRAFAKGGWLKTGDLATVDRDGYLWFTGRKKHIFIRGGENISPQEIEGTLHRHPAVKLAVVVGTRDPVLGEVPVAFVELRNGGTASAADLTSYLARELVHYKVPSSIHLVRDWPLTRTGKVDRRKLCP